MDSTVETGQVIHLFDPVTRSLASLNLHAGSATIDVEHHSRRSVFVLTIPLDWQFGDAIALITWAFHEVDNDR